MKNPYRVAIIDYKMSNMFSVRNALSMLGLESVVTSDYSTILSCDGAILPGVGAFPEAMKHIISLKLDKSIYDFIDTGKPFLGICLGFQLLFDQSEEIENTSGLRVIPGKVKTFSRYNEYGKIRVPHVGWNIITKNKEFEYKQYADPLMNSENGEYYYFVHSCYVEPENNKVLHTTTKYGGYEFCSSILKENIFACQFHPEKSGKKGVRIFNEIFNK